MPFEAGQPRPSKAGRKQGSLNKRSLEAIAIAEEYDTNPIRFLFEVLTGANKDASFDHQMSAAKELMPYLYGKRKPIDSEGNDSADPISELIDALRNP